MRRPRSHHTTASAITLIEMLCALAIVAMLLALLQPGLRAAMMRAREVRCSSNLRQVGLGIAMYAAESKDQSPGTSGIHRWKGDATQGDGPGPGWTELLDAFLGDAGEQVMQCPAFPERPRFNYFLSSRWLTLNARRHWKLGDITIPNRFLLSAECSRRGAYPPGFGSLSQSFDDCDKDDGLVQSLLADGQGDGFYFHQRTNIALFADFHVAGVSGNTTPITYHPSRIVAWDDLVKDP